MEENIRPWGHYDILEEAETFKVKKITVKPGERLSLQSHEHRSEVWTIVQGNGMVTIDAHNKPVRDGNVVHIFRGEVHRIKNTGDQDLIFIEVQYGTYFGEDDIVRYEDDYGRK